MVAKKDPKDKFKRITFTASPVLEKNVIEKAKAEKRTISGVIVELLEKWLSDEPIHTDITNTNLTLPTPPTVDIESLKKEILSEVMKEISTKEKENKTLEPVQSTSIHTDMNQCESITETPTSPDNDVTHIEVSPIEEESIPKRYEAVNTGKPDQKEREKLSDDIRQFMIEFSPIIKARQIETGEKNKRKIQKELFGFTDSEVSQIVKPDYSLSRKQYNKYMALMAEARKKYESVHTDMNTT